MKHKTTYALISILALASCHTTGPTNIRPAQSTPALKAVPEWVNEASQVAAEDAPQIEIETKFIERDFEEGSGVPTSVRDLAQVKGNDILSAPRVTVLAGQVARINIVQELAYPSKDGGKEDLVSEDIGVSCHLRVIPKEDPETLEVDFFADHSELERWVETGEVKQPIISRRQIDTKVLLRSGETTILGGLVSEDRKRELFVAVTPTLVK
jgi:type II secretory pathway component GspD/PulD (secretin)